MRSLAILAVPLLASCSLTDSSDVLTSGMHAELDVTATEGGSASVSGTLFLGDPLDLDFISLTNGDELIATHDGLSRIMVGSEIVANAGYTANFRTSGAEDLEFAIDLRRSVDDGAPRSIATLPAPFTIDPPPALSSRVAPLTLTWSPSGTVDAMSWFARGDCIEDAGSSITADSGTVTLEANAFVKKQGTVPDTCHVVFSIVRARGGELDPHYGKGGSISGRQLRSTELMSTP